VSAVGLGLYTLNEAAQLVGTETRAVKRWLFGYRHSGDRESPPLWSTQYAQADLGEAVIGFRDLVELRYVREFVRRGVPLIIIRRCLDAAKQLFGADYPFTAARFVTDGATIFHEAMREGILKGELLDLKTRQYAFREIIKDSLYTGIEYEGPYARRWFPQPRSKVIVLDPASQFGHPSVADGGVPTASIYASYLAEGKKSAIVARLFELEPRQVNAAVKFEERLRQAA
jgi:uncharacterized protein (DUF433 family)